METLESLSFFYEEGGIDFGDRQRERIIISGNKVTFKKILYDISKLQENVLFEKTFEFEDETIIKNLEAECIKLFLNKKTFAYDYPEGSIVIISMRTKLNLLFEYYFYDEYEFTIFSRLRDLLKNILKKENISISFLNY